MANNQTLTTEEAGERLLLSYKDGHLDSFMEFMKRRFLDPIEQHGKRNKRKLHPMLVVSAVLFLVAAAALVFFSQR